MRTRFGNGLLCDGQDEGSICVLAISGDRTHLHHASRLTIRVALDNKFFSGTDGALVASVWVSDPRRGNTKYTAKPVERPPSGTTAEFTIDFEKQDPARAVPLERIVNFQIDARPIGDLETSDQVLVKSKS